MQNVLNLLRSWLPKSVKTSAKKMLGRPLTSLHSDWSILSTIGPVEKQHVIFDLGARNGWFFYNWKEWCPQAEVHAFEPDIAAYQRLQLRYAQDKLVKLSPLGIGETQSVETFYHMAGSEVSSSFLQHNDEVWDQLKYQTGDIETRELEITTLDHYANEHAIDSIYLMKIDIQGYELRALRGATKVLRKTDYILVESSIKPLYQDAASFTQVHDHLVEQGFHLMNLRAWHRGNQVLMETDMLFRRDDLAESIGEGTEFDRQYISI